MSATAQRPGMLDRPAQSRGLLGRTALLGLLLFVVSIGTFAPESAPDPGTATAKAIRRFSAENAGTIRLNLLAALLSVALLVFFVAGLAQQIREVRRSSTVPVVMVAMAGIVAGETLFVAAVSSVFGRPHDLTKVSDGAIVGFYRTMAIAEWLYTLTVLAPCMVVVATYSWFALRNRLIARWVSVTGLAVAAAGWVATLGLALPSHQFDAFLIPLFAWFLWPLAVGGAMSVRWWRLREHSSISLRAHPGASTSSPIQRTNPRPATGPRRVSARPLGRRRRLSFATASRASTRAVVVEIRAVIDAAASREGMIGVVPAR